MKLRTRTWWALVRSEAGLPVIFATREQARENRDYDERIVHVRVEAVHPQQRALKLPRPTR